MMYLSQLQLNPRSREAQSDIADRYALHRTVLSAFPESMPDKERVLFRLETYQRVPVLLVQSLDAPQWDKSPRVMRNGYLLADIGLKSYSPMFSQDQRLQFRLTANPTVKRDGKRHALRAQEDQERWLERKAGESGFQLNAVQVRDVLTIQGQHRKMKWQQVRFDGLLTVTDVEMFSQAIRNGIGSAKGFGFGLLSVAPESIQIRGG